MARDSRELASAWTRFQRHDFPSPSPDLAPFVSSYWIVEWAYDTPYRQLTVPYPNVHLTFRDARPPEVHGVSSTHVVKELVGEGRVVGVAFHPGGFRSFLRSPVSTVTDRTVPAADVPTLSGPPSAPDIAAIERWFRAARPEPDPTARWVAGVVDRVATEPAITRQAHLTRDFASMFGEPPTYSARRY